MKIKAILFSVIIAVLFTSCIQEKKGKSAVPDLFEQYEEQDGFVIMNIPSVLVKVALNSASEGNDSDLFNDVKKVKVLIFDQGENSQIANDVAKGIKDITDHDFELVSSINSEGQLVSIYVHQKQVEAIDEIILLVSGNDDIICMDFVGEIDLKKFITFATEFKKNDFKFDID